MARIELRDCDVILQDGLSGTAKVNEPSSPPQVGATEFDIDNVSLNTAVAIKVPVGARFNVVGETTPVFHTVTARTQNQSGTNAKQSVTIDSDSSGGTLTLSCGGHETAGIAYNADAAAVKAALVAMDDGYTTDDWGVTGGPGPATPWVVEFKGALGAAPQPLLVGDGSSLTGGGTDVAVATTVVGAAAAGSTTTNIEFSPALGSGTYADNAVVTFYPQNLSIKIGDGNITYTEHKEYEYLLDRGNLDTVRESKEAPMDVKLEAVYEHITQGTSEPVSPMDALKQTGGAAEWVSSSDDPCEPYAIDLIVLYTPPCGTAENEKTTFPDFRADSKEVNFKDATISMSGKCNATEPIVERGV